MSWCKARVIEFGIHLKCPKKSANIDQSLLSIDFCEICDNVENLKGFNEILKDKPLAPLTKRTDATTMESIDICNKRVSSMQV